MHVIEGNIAEFPVDAVITAINSSKAWWGAIDEVIRQYATSQFHEQAARALSANPRTKVVVAPKVQEHIASFEHVVFTIDDLTEDLEVVVRRGLDAAASAGYKTVSMPAIRFGVMRNTGGTPQEKIQAIAAAIKAHEHRKGQVLKSVTVVVFNDPDLALQLRAALT